MIDEVASLSALYTATVSCTVEELYMYASRIALLTVVVNHYKHHFYLAYRKCMMHCYLGFFRLEWYSQTLEYQVDGDNKSKTKKANT